MSEPVWKLMPIRDTHSTQVAWREFPDGKQESCLVTADKYLKWLAEGNEPEPADESQPE